MPTGIESWFIGQDRLGPTTALTYKSNRKHGTIIGGCCSLMIVIFIWLYIIAQVFTLIYSPYYSNWIEVDYINPNTMERYDIGLDQALPMIMTAHRSADKVETFNDEELFEIQFYLQKTDAWSSGEQILEAVRCDEWLPPIFGQEIAD